MSSKPRRIGRYEFKSPIGGGSHDFHAQFLRLLEYALAHASRR